MMIDANTREMALKWTAEKQAVKGVPLVIKNVTQVVSADNVVELNAAAVKIAVKIIKPYEGLSLRAYPDVASPLSMELSKHNILRKFIAGDLVLPPYLAKLSGAPWSIGYGCAEGIKQGDVWTLEQAENDLNAQVVRRMKSVLKSAPKLSKASPEAIAACVSLAYNIGLDEFATSTVVKCIAKDDMQAAGDAFLLFDNAQGVKDVPGLQARRKSERALFLSVRV